MSADLPQPDRELESLLSALAPRGLDRQQVMYAAGRAAALAEAQASARRTVRRWQGAAATMSAVAAALAVAVALPSERTAAPTAAPVVVAAEPAQDADAIAPAAGTPAMVVAAPWRRAPWTVRELRSADSRVLQTGMSPLEMRQVLLRDDQCASSGSAGPVSPPEPLTPRSFDQILRDHELRRNSST